MTVLGDGNATQIAEGGVLNLTMSLMPGSRIFNISAVEYNRLAIFVSCLRLKTGQTSLVVFVITRDLNLSPTEYEEKLKELGLDPKSLTKMRQKNCPEPKEPCTIVTGRKRCSDC